MITLHGPAWPTIHTLRTALAGVPEVGEFRMGGPPTGAITQLEAFRGVGLATPDFTTDRTEAIHWLGEARDNLHTTAPRITEIVFGRKLIHTRGNDIVLPRFHRRSFRIVETCRWWNSEWWSKYIPPTEEWRVHVFDGKTIARGRKIHTGSSWRKAPVRNVGNGWTYDFHGEPPKGLRKVAKAAVGALGYPHGAVDILQADTIDPTAPEGVRRMFYILEVNRIPALTCPYTFGAWVGAIRRHVREHQT